MKKQELLPRHDRKRLISLLNKPAKSRGKNAGRMLTLIAQINEANENQIAEIEELESELRKLLEQYPMWPRIKRRRGGGLVVHWFTVGPTADDPRMEDLELVRRLLAAASIGDLAKVGRCKWRGCRKWFMGRLMAQPFCCTAHRVKAFRSTEKFKEQHRKYMREYYRLQKKNVR